MPLDHALPCRVRERATGAVYAVRDGREAGAGVVVLEREGMGRRARLARTDVAAAFEPLDATCERDPAGACCTPARMTMRAATARSD